MTLWGAHLSDTTDIFIPISLAEAKVFVQTEADVVTVQTVGELAQVQKVLFQSTSDGGLERMRNQSASWPLVSQLPFRWH